MLGVRLPRDCTDAVSAPLQLMDVPEGDYLVFEHGPFDLQTENSLVEAKIERVMRDFDYEANKLLSGYRTRSCVLFICARLCTFLEVYPACCSILKKKLKFFLDGDIVIQLLIFTYWKGIS